MKSKKAQLGLDMVQKVILTLFVIIILAVAAIVGVVSLRNSNIVTAGSVEANQTNGIISNFTTGVSGFFGNTGTIFNLLFVAVIMLILGVVIAVIYRFAGGGNKSGGL